MSLKLLADKYNATIISTLNEIKDVPADKHIAFQTKDYKIILSPKDKVGFRTVIARV